MLYACIFVRKAQSDQLLQVSNLLLINSIIDVIDDLDTRIHLRNQMEASGLRRILEKLRAFRHPTLDRQLSGFEEVAASDNELLRESYDRNILQDVSDPYDVLRAVLSSVEGTRAQDFLISALKHLLLIREEGETRVRYFQLIDRLITTIILDGKAVETDFTQLLGRSVAAVIGRFSDMDRMQAAVDDAAKYKSQLVQVQQDKKELEDELEAKQGGLVGQLKNKLGRTEEDLRTSRLTTNSLEAQIAAQEQQQREKEAYFEIQINELFNMLKEARMLEAVEDDSGILDRRELLALVGKKIERTKAIYALEGRAMTNDGSRKSKSSLGVDQGPEEPSKSPRRSRFEDAADEIVRQHIEDSLAANAAKLVCGPDCGLDKSDSVTASVWWRASA